LGSGVETEMSQSDFDPDQIDFSNITFAPQDGID